VNPVSLLLLRLDYETRAKRGLVWVVLGVNAVEEGEEEEGES